jgi:hypothetical protein
MIQDKSRWIFFGILGVLVVLLIIFFFFTSPLHLPSSMSGNASSTSMNASNSTTTSVLTQNTIKPGEYPAGFPTDLVLFPNLSPISGGSIVDTHSKTHLIAEFLPEASVAQVFNVYRTKLPPLGWTITSSGSTGNTAKTVVMYVTASKGSSTLDMTVQTVAKLGTQMRLEIIQ